MACFESCGVQTYETEVDGGCEQEHDFEIVRCSGHQHIGSRCITLFNAENGEQICKSCPVYGTVEGECMLPAFPGPVLVLLIVHSCSCGKQGSLQLPTLCSVVVARCCSHSEVVALLFLLLSCSCDHHHQALLELMLSVYVASAPLY